MVVNQSEARISTEHGINPDITYSTEIALVGHRSDFELIQQTPYLTHEGWSSIEMIVKNKQCFHECNSSNSIANALELLQSCTKPSIS